MVAPPIVRSVLQGAMLESYRTILHTKANNYNKKLIKAVKLIKMLKAVCLLFVFSLYIWMCVTLSR